MVAEVALLRPVGFVSAISADMSLHMAEHFIDGNPDR